MNLLQKEGLWTYLETIYTTKEGCQTLNAINLSIKEVVIPFVRKIINPYNFGHYLNEKYEGRVGLESCCFE
jgi:hypothetical protein